MQMLQPSPAARDYNLLPAHRAPPFGGRQPSSGLLTFSRPPRAAAEEAAVYWDPCA